MWLHPYPQISSLNFFSPSSTFPSTLRNMRSWCLDPHCMPSMPTETSIIILCSSFNWCDQALILDALTNLLPKIFSSTPALFKLSLTLGCGIMFISSLSHGLIPKLFAIMTRIPWNISSLIIHMMIFSLNIEPGCYTLELLGMIIHTLKILIDDELEAFSYPWYHFPLLVLVKGTSDEGSVFTLPKNQSLLFLSSAPSSYYLSKTMEYQDINQIDFILNTE